jgi:hypothetical protein
MSVEELVSEAKTIVDELNRVNTMIAEALRQGAEDV